jgi:hypothetical protein
LVSFWFIQDSLPSYGVTFSRPQNPFGLSAHHDQAVIFEDGGLFTRTLHLDVSGKVRGGQRGKRSLAKEAHPQNLKGTTLPKQGFYDALVFVTDGHDFLDHICFEFGLLECPEKLFDFLMITLDASCTKPLF